MGGAIAGNTSELSRRPQQREVRRRRRPHVVCKHRRCARAVTQLAPVGSRTENERPPPADLPPDLPSDLFASSTPLTPPEPHRRRRHSLLANRRASFRRSRRERHRRARHPPALGRAACGRHPADATRSAGEGTAPHRSACRGDAATRRGWRSGVLTTVAPPAVCSEHEAPIGRSQQCARRPSPIAR